MGRRAPGAPRCGKLAGMNPLGGLHRIRAGVLDLAFHASGPQDGPPVVLLHGFPYDVHSYEEVAPRLAAQGCRVLVPHLRGHGPTRFLAADTPRSGEQAALGADLLAFMDALALPRAVLAGYDWGGRAACVVAALWPQRCRGLVSVNSYNIQDIPHAGEPDTPEAERRLWYQYYFHTERGRRGLAQNRRALAHLLWREWSPTWAFDPACFERSAPAYDNPDYVEVVIHSYRHRYGIVPGDAAYAAIEQQLAAQPRIAVPSLTFDGADDGVRPACAAAAHARHFSGPRDHDVVPGVGHNLPQEWPEGFAAAVLRLARG